MRYIDLHIHSTFSDGTMAPAALLRAAKEADLSAVALTDHDTIAGLGEAESAGAATGIEVIAGVELSAARNGKTVHILGYGFDRNNFDLLALLKKMQEIRHNRNMQILARLAERGIDITGDELAAANPGGLIGRPHIARLLVKKKVVSGIEQAFRRYLKKGGLAYAAAERFPATATIGTIKKAGGLAVLAHPATFAKSLPDMAENIIFLHGHGLDGIEAIYPGHTTKIRKGLFALAEKHQLLITGGSDFHGTFTQGINIGGAPVMPPVPYKLLEKIKERLRRP
ncbi:MAG: PHP domain-containing protein [Desulfobulbales bacterium]|nr:PHP domain-containing protein [Desulfobulbales bacterium]